MENIPRSGQLNVQQIQCFVFFDVNLRNPGVDRRGSKFFDLPNMVVWYGRYGFSNWYVLFKARYKYKNAELQVDAAELSKSLVNKHVAGWGHMD